MEELCRIADDHDVDCVLIAGDVYDSPKPPDDAEDLFYKTVHRLSRNGKRAVVVSAGNHDSPRGLETSDPLARECGIGHDIFLTEELIDQLPNSRQAGEALPVVFEVAAHVSAMRAEHAEEIAACLS